MGLSKGPQPTKTAARVPSAMAPTLLRRLRFSYSRSCYCFCLVVPPLPHQPNGGFFPRKMAASPSKSEILSLFRSLLRVAREFSDYNIREYAKRRTVDGFRHNRLLSDPSSIAAAYADAESQLNVARRQVIVYSLYAPKLKSVMEIKHA